MVKGTSARPIDGNLPPRLFPTPSGMLNSIGLENVGVDAFIRDKMPFAARDRLRRFRERVRFCEEEYVEVVEKLNDCEGIAAYELNISCPNTKHGGMVFGTEPAADPQPDQSRESAIDAGRVIVKLSPNVTDIAEMASAAEEAGADALDCGQYISGNGHRHGNVQAADPYDHWRTVRTGHSADHIADGVPVRPCREDSGDRLGRDRHRRGCCGVLSCGRSARSRSEPQIFMILERPVRVLDGLEKFLAKTRNVVSKDLIGQMKP